MDTLTYSFTTAQPYTDTQARKLANALIFSKLEDNTAETAPGFLTTSKVNSSAVQNGKLEGFEFTNLYFVNAGEAGTNLTGDTTITRFKRPSWKGTGSLQMHVLTFNTHDVAGDNFDRHNVVAHNIVESFGYTTPEIHNAPIDANTSRLTVTATNLEGTTYAGDSGSTWKIELSVLTDLNTSGPLSFTLASVHQTKDTVCVREDNLQESNLSTSTHTWNVDVVGGSTASKFSFVCFNVRIADAPSTNMFTLDSYQFVPGSAPDSQYFDYKSAAAFNVAVPTGGVTAVGETVKPTVDRVEFQQSTNVNGLGSAMIRLDLGRGLRRGQVVVLTGGVNTLYPSTGRPNCRYALTDRTDDDNNMWEDMNAGNIFVSKCVIGEETGDSHSITLTTRRLVASNKMGYSRFVVIRLDGVYAKSLSGVKYAINTYLQEDTTKVIAAAPLAGDARLSFPASTLNALTAVNVPGLCNLTTVFPQLPGANGTFTFEFNLEDAKLKEILEANKEVSARDFNEVTVYMNPRVYVVSRNAWCRYGNENAPCTWTQNGFLNIKLSGKDASTKSSISVSGVSVPQLSTSDSDFLCSINRFTDETRHSIVVGTGKVLVGTFYGADSKRGSLVYYDVDTVNNNTPVESTTFKLRFGIDSTQGYAPNTSQFSFQAQAQSKNVLYVRFPEEFNFRDAQNVSASLSQTNWNTDTAVTDLYAQATQVKVGTPTIHGRYVRVELDTEKLDISDSVAFFDLVFSNLPTPWNPSTVGQTRVFLMDDDKAPKNIYTSYPNTHNSFSGTSTTYMDYAFGPSFWFNDAGLGLLQLENHRNMVVRPGRYASFVFSTQQRNANTQTKVTLNADPVFKSLSAGVVVDTGRSRTGQLRVGVPCGTLRGRYWITFSLDNQAEWYKFAPVVVEVTRIAGNKGLITVSSTMDFNDGTAFTLAPAGFVKLHAMTQEPPVEDVKLTLQGATENSNKFKRNDPQGNEKINAGENGTMFAYEASEKLEAVQKVTVSADNKCFGFGSARAASKDLTFATTDTLTDISKVTLASTFFYVAPGEKDAANMFRVQGRGLLGGTRVLVGVACADAKLPNAESWKGLQNNPKHLMQLLAASPLQRFYHESVTKDTATKDFVFEGLQRGQTFKLVMVVWNNSVSGTPTAQESLELVDSADATKKSALKTSEVADRQYLHFTAERKVSEAMLDRFHFKLQEKTNALGGMVTVVDGDGNTNKGYSVPQKSTCTADLLDDRNAPKPSPTATTVAPTTSTAAPTTSTTTPTTSTATPTGSATTLRYLQATTTTSTTTTTTASTSTSTASASTSASATPVPEVVNETDEYFLLIQEASDNSRLDLTTFITSLQEAFGTVEKFNKELAMEEKLEGSLSLGPVSDPVLEAKNFSAGEFKWDGTTGLVTFIALGDRSISCSWKQNKSETTTHVLLTKDVIVNCPAPADAKATVTCGKFTFHKDNKAVTTLNIGAKNAQTEFGTYFIDVHCQSELPLSVNEVTFLLSPNGFTVSKPAEPTPTPTAEPTTSVNSRYATLSLIILAFCLFFLFDF